MNHIEKRDDFVNTDRAASLTIFTASNLLCKQISLNAGKLETKSGQLFMGEYEVVEFDCLDDFRYALSRLDNNKFIAFGVPSHARGIVLSQKKLKDIPPEHRQPTIITRTNSCISYSDKKAGVLMLDFDELPDHISDIEALDSVLSSIIPQWGEAEVLYRPSSSCFLYDKNTGAQLKGFRIHAFVLLHKASLIPAAGKAISNLLAENGIKLDESMYSPSHQCYVSATYTPNIERRAPNEVLRAGEHRMLPIDNLNLGFTRISTKRLTPKIATPTNDTTPKSRIAQLSYTKYNTLPNTREAKIRMCLALMGADPESASSRSNRDSLPRYNSSGDEEPKTAFLNILYALRAHEDAWQDGFAKTVAYRWHSQFASHDDEAFETTWEYYDPKKGVNVGTLYNIANRVSPGWDKPIGAKKNSEVAEPSMMETKEPETFEEVLDYMNSKYAVIEDRGGKTCVLCERVEDEKLSFHFKSFKDLSYLETDQLYYEVNDKPRTIDYYSCWMKQGSKRRSYRSVVLDPSTTEKDVNGNYNIFKGLSVAPIRGDCSHIRGYIKGVLASGNEEHFKYIWNWLAFAVQNPGKVSEVALVLIGKKGTGKSTLGVILMQIFGEHSMLAATLDSLTGGKSGFNGHLEDKCLVVADDAVWGGDKQATRAIQTLITSPEISIHHKGLTPYRAKNHIKLLSLAEPGWSVPAGQNERRYAVFTVSDRFMQDESYFKPIYEQINNDGLGAFLFELANTDLRDWHPRRSIPQTEALQEQKHESLDSISSWWREVLRSGVLPGSYSGSSNRVSLEDLWRDVKDSVGATKYVTRPQLTKFISKYAVRKNVAGATRLWVFKDLGDLRTEWEKEYGHEEWDKTEEWYEPSMSTSNVVPLKPNK